jgi:hypothetical protein
MTIPTVTNDSVVITAAVRPFVRCDVTTTVGGDNNIDLGYLEYGSVSTVADAIRISGGTNAPHGMSWYYRSDAAVNGLYSTTTSATLTGSDAERTLSATTLTCAAGTPCYGIYYNGTNSAGTGTFVANAAFTGGTVSTSVGPMTTNTYGQIIASSNALPASNVTADFNVNATAAESSPVATDYTDTLIFTCKADL